MDISKIELTNADKRALDDEGVLVLPSFVAGEKLLALRNRINQLFSQLGEHAGAEFKQEPQTDRLANLINYDEIFHWAIAEPRLLNGVSQVLGDGFKLSSLNARSARPHSDWTQPLHCDMGLLPDERGAAVCNVVWMLDDFTEQNGATRYVPGSHRWQQLPQEALDDPSLPCPGERLLIGAPGTVAVMNAHLWHGGTANQTDRPRLAMHSFYCRLDLPQQQYQKRLLTQEVQAGLSSQLRRLLALDDTLNDELSSQGSGLSGFLK